MRKNSLFLNIEYLFLHLQIRTHFVRSLRREEHEYYKFNFCWTNYFLVAVLLHIHFILFVMMTICDSSSLNKVDLTWTPPTVWDNVLFYWTQNKIILNYLHFLHEPSHADHDLLLIPGKVGCQKLLQLKELETLSGRRQPWSRTPPPDRLGGLCTGGSKTTGDHIFWETEGKRK